MQEYLNATKVPLLLHIISSINSIIQDAYMPNQKPASLMQLNVELLFAYDEENQSIISYFEIDMLLLQVFI